jgi:xanthine/uracil permease
MNTTFARIHKGLAFYISLGVFVQMFLAGVWHSGVVNTPDAHVFFGLSLLLASLLALIAAAVAKLPKPVIGRTALLFFLILLQPILMETRRNGLPFISAFHALNAPFIGIVAGTVVAMARGSQAETSEEGALSVATGD